MSSRRTFLKASSLACAVSALHPMLHAQNAAVPDPFSNQNMEPYQEGLLTRSTFKAVLQSLFTLFLADGSTRTMRLVDVSDPVATTVASPIQAVGSRTASAQKPRASAGSTPVALPDHSFTLSFDVAGGSFPQGTYTLDHATLGRLALFLVPASSDSAAMSCTAVFNNVVLTAAITKSLGTQTGTKLNKLAHTLVTPNVHPSRHGPPSIASPWQTARP